MSRCGVAGWRLVDAICTGVLEVLGILAWYGVYQYVVENLPTAPEVGIAWLCGHLLNLSMAGRPPHRKPSSNSTGFCHRPLGADASGRLFATSILILNPCHFDSLPPLIGRFIYKLRICHQLIGSKACQLQKYKFVAPVSHKYAQIWQKYCCAYPTYIYCMITLIIDISPQPLELM